jgi:hypothetical protein
LFDHCSYKDGKPQGTFDLSLIIKKIKMKKSFVYMVCTLAVALVLQSCQKTIVVKEEPAEPGIGAAGNYGPFWVTAGRPAWGGCWCTEYVAVRVIGQNVTTAPGFPNAKDWGRSWLPNKGYGLKAFSASALPQNKDVIVIKAGYFGVGQYGHVALVGSSWKNANGTITIRLIGANQTPDKTKWSNKCGCPNESAWDIIVNAGDSRIEIYRKSNPALKC